MEVDPAAIDGADAWQRSVPNERAELERVATTLDKLKPGSQLKLRLCSLAYVDAVVRTDKVFARLADDIVVRTDSQRAAQMARRRADLLAKRAELDPTEHDAQHVEPAEPPVLDDGILGEVRLVPGPGGEGLFYEIREEYVEPVAPPPRRRAAAAASSAALQAPAQEPVRVQPAGEGTADCQPRIPPLASSDLAPAFVGGIVERTTVPPATRLPPAAAAEARTSRFKSSREAVSAAKVTGNCRLKNRDVI